MSFNISRRGVIRITAFILSAFLVLGGFAAKAAAESSRRELIMNSGWCHAFGEFATSMNKISIALQKSAVATGPALAALTNEISRESALALGAISALPYSGHDFEKTSTFISKLGDYTAYLSRVESAGTGISYDEREKITALYTCAEQLNKKISELYTGVADGSIPVGAALNFERSGETVDVIGDAISDIELEFPEYPGLIYDGPFSEHITSVKPKFTEGKKLFSPKEALIKAAEAFDISLDVITLAGESTGSLPTYCFAVENDEGSMYIDVSKYGGYITEMMCIRSREGAPNLSSDECIRAARTFLSNLVSNDMTESYHITENGIVTVNFAYTAEDVVIYPDLIKVSVSASSGEIVGFEARGFIMNHTERTIPSPSINESDAAKALSPGLEIESSRLAVIPTAGENEKLCYEFLCTTEDSHMLIYINAETGKEEQILILIEDENGTLTI